VNGKNSSKFYLPYPEAIFISLYWKIAMPRTNWLSGQSMVSDQRNRLLADNRYSIKTVLLDSNGDPWREVEKDTYGLSLSLSDIFIMSGKSKDFLDQPFVENDAPNVMPNSDNKFKDGPPIRTSGVRMFVDVKCKAMQDDDKEPICRVSASIDALSWPALRQERWLPSGEKLSKVSHGVKIVLRARGQYQYFGLPFILSILVSAIVLMGLPMGILEVVIFRCMGRLSKCYTAESIEKHSVERSLSHMATQFLLGHMVHKALQPQEAKPSKQEHQQQCSKKERDKCDDPRAIIHSQLRYMVAEGTHNNGSKRDADVNAGEERAVGALAECCWEALMNTDVRSESTRNSFFASLRGTGNDSQSSNAGQLMAGKLCVALASSAPVGEYMDFFVRGPDTHRSPLQKLQSPLERLFVPSILRRRYQFALEAEATGLPEDDPTDSDEFEVDGQMRPTQTSEAEATCVPEDDKTHAFAVNGNSSL